MRKNINSVHVEGRLYQHELALKTVKNTESENFGKEFIQGKIEIAIDDAGLQVVPVEFTYVGPKTSKGNENKTFTVLSKLLNSGKTVVENGMQEATMVSVNTAFALNDFPVEGGTMVSQMILQGGFVDIVTELKPILEERAKFDLDVVLTGTRRVEADPEKMIDEDYLELRGAAFNFKGDLLPLTLTTKSLDGINFFENQEISNAAPLYTELKGILDYREKVQEIPVEGAFGGPSVDYKRRKVKDWVVNWARKVPYDFGDEQVMTAEDLIKASQNREIYLAEIKKKREEYLAKKAAGGATFGTGVAPTTGFAGVAAGNFSF